MTFWQPHQVQHLRAIPLEAVLPLCGAQPDRQDRRKWHTSQGLLSVTGPKFMNWTQAVGGGGAIDLVSHLNGLDFKAALDWLGRHFPAPFPSPCRSSIAQPKFKLPPPDPAQLRRVQRYLVAERAIAPALIDSLIESGVLYADHHGNAVFLLLPASASAADWAKPNTPVGAELRGTSLRSWRGLAPGSRKDLGWFGLPATVLPTDRSFSVSPPSTPSVALLCIPNTTASPLPVLGPTQLGWRLCWRRAAKSTAASMRTPLVTTWLRR